MEEPTDRTDLNVLHENDNNNDAFSDVETLEYLIKNGVDIHKQDTEGRGLFHKIGNHHYPKDKDFTEVISYLLMKGVNLHTKDNRGKTVLDNLLTISTDVVEYLLEKGYVSKDDVRILDNYVHQLHTLFEYHSCGHYPLNKLSVLNLIKKIIPLLEEEVSISLQ